MKLKTHILPRITAIHQDSETILEPAVPPDDEDALLRLSRLNHVVFNANKIYRHRLLRINYTTYDLQCDYDSINPRADKRDIMLLSNSDDDDHPFCYARVLGIFHTNVIYTGPGSKDYRSRRVEFLWVRWFEIVECRSAPLGWEEYTLDRVKFLPMADKEAFGFVNPADVLRACHIIPSFTDGRLHPERAAMSRCAGDSDDWKYYYINR